MRNRGVRIILLAAALGGLASCAADPKFNQADVDFVTRMISHNQQTGAMAKLAERQAFSPEVRTVAAEIKATQAAEVKLMTTWLRNRGKTTALPSATNQEASDRSGAHSHETVGHLKTHRGPTFDQEFLTMMDERHRTAISMARSELKNGTSRDVKNLAARIGADRVAEIEVMNDLG